MAKRVLILVNTRKPGAAQEVENLRPWLSQHAELVGVVPITGEACESLPAADLCIVFGGDGTLLTATRMLARCHVPLLGVNMGKLGFLAEFNIEHMRRHLDQILAGQIQPTRRMMLEVCVQGGKGSLCSLAANDVAIAAGVPFRMIDLRLDQANSHIARYLGDGLVVATPTGTTGYNMSAGGPILEPTLKAITITPIAPHSLSVRPIVVGSDKPIRITADRVNPGTTLIVDGQINSGLELGDVVEIRRADCEALIIPHPGRDFFATLSSKLQWGRSPHHPGL